MDNLSVTWVEIFTTPKRVSVSLKNMYFPTSDFYMCMSLKSKISTQKSPSVPHIILHLHLSNERFPNQKSDHEARKNTQLLSICPADGFSKGLEFTLSEMADFFLTLEDVSRFSSLGLGASAFDAVLFGCAGY